MAVVFITNYPLNYTFYVTLTQVGYHTSKPISSVVYCFYKITLRWLNTVLAVCECMSFAKSWQEKGYSSQAETWRVKNILMRDFD